MVRFILGYNRYTFKPDSQPLLEKVVKDLNDVFVSYQCPFHSSAKMSIEVDLMKNGHLQLIGDRHNDGCSYVGELIDKEVVPFLTAYGIFPLPFE